jgi:hypothetical protein
VRRLPETVDEAWSERASNGPPIPDTPAQPPVAHTS